MDTNSQVTIDFRAVSHALLFYLNQFGEQVRVRPKKPSLHGKTQLNEPCFQSIETIGQRAERLGYLDRWTTHCIFQLRNNHSLHFTGSKATKMFRNYNKHIYEKS